MGGSGKDEVASDASDLDDRDLSDRDDVVSFAHSRAESRLSKSKPCQQRSDKRKSDKREKHLAECKARTLAAGGVWVDRSHEEQVELERRAMLVPTTASAAAELQSRPALEIIERNMRDLARLRRTREEAIAHMKFVDSLFAPHFQTKPKNMNSCRVAEVAMLFPTGMNEDEFICVLCDKKVWGGRWASHDNHLPTDGHRLRVQEHAACDEMVGRAYGPRRFSATPGLTGPLLWCRFRRYWGEEIHQMEQLIWDRLRSGTKLIVDMPHWGKSSKMELGLDRVSHVLFGAVPYGGAGKYSDNYDDAHFVPFSRFERLIDDDHVKEAVHAAPGKGFWPVCQIKWHDVHLDHGFTSATEYERAVKVGRCKVYILCWYQLLQGGHVIAVWAILLIRE